eukprot:5850778-Lingulodinium_polyedra.AAC.1
MAAAARPPMPRGAPPRAAPGEGLRTGQAALGEPDGDGRRVPLALGEPLGAPRPRMAEARAFASLRRMAAHAAAPGW